CPPTSSPTICHLSLHDALPIWLMQIQHLHYAVDLDIHGFFDNVNHGKLIRQMWELGIRDKKLLCIIKQMLRAPIVLPDGKRIYPDRKSTRLNSSHVSISYAVFC